MSLYSELEPGYIRLVKLRRRAEDNKLEASLEIRSFLQQPQFEALSWVWGDIENVQMVDFPLSREGHPGLHDFRIPPNLHTAFSRIMAATPPGAERTLWADYISINQSPRTRMGDVYEKAQGVLVWLGDPPEGEQNIADCMKLLPKIVESIRTLAKEVGIRAEPYGYDGLPECAHRVWAVFADIARKGWYRRMWMLQEAVLAKELTFHYGTKILDWDQIFKLSAAYGQTPLLRQAADDREGHFWRPHHAMTIQRYRLRHQKGMPIDFVHLLQLGMYKGCTVDADCVFGILGLAEKSARERILVQVNTKSPVRDVYMAAFTEAVFCDPDLHFLSLPVEHGGRYDLPSWVLDLSRWNGRDPQAQPARKRTRPADSAPIKVLDGGRLRIRGVEVDRISKVVPGPFPGPDIREPGKRRRLLAAFYSDSLKLTQAAPSAPPDAHWQTLVQGAQGIHSSFSAQDALFGYKYYLKEAKFDKLDPRVHQTPEQQRLGASYSHFMLQACTRRRYFKSENARVGLAPEKCQVGDVVCVFQGAGVPHILRRNVDTDQGVSETFSFIGDCYAHGLMESEIIDKFGEGTLALRDFDIT